MPDPPLTPAQLLYLDAFDDFLLADTFMDRLRAREDMATRLNFVLAEADIRLPSDTRWSDQDHAGNNRAHGCENVWRER